MTAFQTKVTTCRMDRVTPIHLLTGGTPGAWPKALHGVEAAYISFYPDLAVPSAPEAIEELTSCAVKAGVKQLVLLSGRGEVNALRCENIVRESGVSYTLIRASWFSQNFNEGHLLESVLSGVVALPAGDVREPFVDADDIADVAVASLTDERHAGQLYELTGPRLLTFAEAIAEIAKASGRDIQYTAIWLEQFRTALAKAPHRNKFTFTGVEASARQGARNANNPLFN